MGIGCDADVDTGTAQGTGADTGSARGARVVAWDGAGGCGRRVRAREQTVSVCSVAELRASWMAITWLWTVAERSAGEAGEARSGRRAGDAGGGGERGEEEEVVRDCGIGWLRRPSCSLDDTI